MTRFPAHDSPTGMVKVMYMSKYGKTSKTIGALD